MKVQKILNYGLTFLVSLITLLPFSFFSPLAYADTSWNIVSSSGPSLNSIAAVSASDIWTVGGTTIEHWDGNRWSIVSSPNPGGSVQLESIAAVSANDVWAVGVRGDYSNLTLIEHWDGNSWSIVSSPNNPYGYGGNLSSVTAISANDVWAVGYYINGSYAYTLTEHWDGNSWSTVSSPNLTGTYPNNSLTSVAGVSANDIWAVGYGPTGTLLEHWDGNSWSIDPSSGGNGNLFGVSAVSPTDAWAVGINSGALIEHWDGTNWNVVSSPTVYGVLTSVAAVSATDIWAVGYYESASNIEQTLTEHWDGTNWSIISSPNQGTDHNSLYGVAAVTTNNIWAVGNSGNGTNSLIEQYSPTTTNTPTPTTTPTPTPTPAPTYSISGTVYVDTNQNGAKDREESGYSGATVSLNTGQSTTTDTNGAYSFTSIPGGVSIDETLTLPDGYTATTTNPVTLSLSTDTTENFGIAPAATPTPISYSVPFRLDTDGYSFKNWSDDNADIQFKAQWDAMLATYNPADIPVNLYDNVVLTKLEATYKKDGYCFGMASTSILYWQNPNLKPAPSKTTYALSKDAPDYAINNIVEYQQKQFPIYLDSMQLNLNTQSNPTNEYTTLLDDLQNKHKPAMLMMFGTDTSTGEGAGHAVVAYSIIDNGNTKTIQVYDNNHPLDSSKTATFDLSANTFSYSDSTVVYNQVYVRDPSLDFPDSTSQTISNAFYAVSHWLNTNNLIQAVFHSPVTALFIDDQGHRFGYVNGTFVNEIPSAQIHQLDDETVYYLPSTSQYTLTTTGTQDATAGATLGIDITLPTSGTQTKWINYTGIPVSPGSTTTQTVGSSNIDYAIQLSAGGTKTPDEIASMDDTIQTIYLPKTTASLSPTQNPDNTYPDPVTVTLTANASSGLTIATTYYTVDSGSQQTYSSPFTVTGGGNHTITYWSVDTQGNREAANSKTLTIVTPTPTSTPTPTPLPTYSIRGTIYTDMNKNGVQDTPEPDYQGATVTLSGGANSNTTTDSNGNYSFPSLQSGSYTLTLTLPTGYSTTTTNPASVSLTADTTVNFGIVQNNLIGQDTFHRANQTHWGTASDGQTWAGDANTNNTFSITNNTGQQASGLGTTYNALLGASVTDAQVLFSGSLSSFSNANIGAVLRWTDGNNWYKAYIDGSNLWLQKKVNGTTTNLKNVTFTATAGTNYTLRFQVSGTTLSAKVWQTGTTEPANWTATETDSSLSAGYCGLRVLTQSGETATYTSFTAASL